MKAVLLVAIVALSATLTAQDTDRARAEVLAERAAARLQTLHQEADRLLSEERTLLGDLRKLEVQRQIKTEELRRLDAEAAAAAANLAAVNAEVQRLEREEEAARPQLEGRLVELYKLGEPGYVRMMLSMTDMSHVIRATRMVSVVARRDHDQILAHQRRIADLSTSRVEIQENTRKLAALRTDASRARTALEQAVEERNALIADVDRRRDLNAQLSGELQIAQDSLQVRLRPESGGSPSPEPLALPLRPFQGELEWPVTGNVRQRFGRQPGSAATINGIEMGAPEGAPVKAVHDGTVAFADAFSGFGRLVIIDHGGQSFSVYGNLAEISVEKGNRVDTGAQVGTVGPSVLGVAGLHFELHVDGQPVDPLQWLKKR